MDEYTANAKLSEGLSKRHEDVQKALAYVRQTKHLFAEYGSPELKTQISRLDSLEKSLESDTVKLVVIGEFSRGKSTLINALLGIRLLLTAREQTTAVNTFIMALPKGESDQYIIVHFKDPAKSPQRLVWNDDSALEKWGTELDKTHVDVRKTVERIEAFSSHPLLNDGLVLIDTPGLEGVIEHHRDITMQAIDQSHMAIWVQSAESLGGNRCEWEFLNAVIHKNFRKFITVVNMWDKIIEPDDEQDRRKTLADRENEKIGIVRKNFRDKLENARPEEIETLTSSDHLMGVSALWGLKKNDPEKRRLSQIDRLAERIADMCTGEEARKEILAKPLRQLGNIQSELKKNITEWLEVLNSSKDIEVRRRDNEQLEIEIQNLETGQEQTTKEARFEHQNAATAYAKTLQEEMVTPLRELKAEIEQYVTRQYVISQIEKGVTQIGLPKEIQTEYEQTASQMKRLWKDQKEKIEKALIDLGVAYQDKLQDHFKSIHAVMNSLEITIPDLDIKLDIDFSELETYHHRSMELEKEIQEKDETIAEIEADTAENTKNELKLKQAQDAVAYARKRLDSLGPAPSPITRSKTQQISEGGWFSGPEFETVDYVDDSNVNTYRERENELEGLLSDERSALDKIIAEEEAKTRRRLSNEAALKKYHQKIEMLKRQIASEKKKGDAHRDGIIEQALLSLSRNTTVALSRQISFLETQASKSIQDIFDKHLDCLLECVKEQFTEPLQAKYKQREAVITAIEQGEQEVRKQCDRLNDGLKQLADLERLTRIITPAS